MSWTDFTIACLIGIVAGFYTFTPLIKKAREHIERQEALKEIQARRKAEAEKSI